MRVRVIVVVECVFVFQFAFCLSMKVCLFLSVWCTMHLKVVHGPPSQAPCFTGQLSHEFCRSSPSLVFFFGPRVATHLTVVLTSLQSVVSVVTASWFKVKESIIS